MNDSHQRFNQTAARLNKVFELRDGLRYHDAEKTEEVLKEILDLQEYVVKYYPTQEQILDIVSDLHIAISRQRQEALSRPKIFLDSKGYPCRQLRILPFRAIPVHLGFIGFKRYIQESMDHELKHPDEPTHFYHWHDLDIVGNENPIEDVNCEGEELSLLIHAVQNRMSGENSLFDPNTNTEDFSSLEALQMRGYVEIIGQRHGFFTYTSL